MIGTRPVYIPRPGAEIPQCISPISHNAPFCNRNVHISVTKWCIVGYLFHTLWDLRDGSISHETVFALSAGPRPSANVWFNYPYSSGLLHWNGTDVWLPVKEPGGCFNKKMSSYKYKDHHVLPPSLSLTWESPHMERQSLYWDGALKDMNEACKNSIPSHGNVRTMYMTLCFITLVHTLVIQV